MNEKKKSEPKKIGINFFKRYFTNVILFFYQEEYKYTTKNTNK